MCPICGSKRALHDGKIHIQGKGMVVVKLCYLHDVELFKIGQLKFLDQYKKQIHPFLNKNETTDEMVFV